MNQEHYCTEEVSKLLKQIGFDEECRLFYHSDKYHVFDHECFTVKNSELKASDDFGIPLLQQASFWIWDKYEFNVFHHLGKYSGQLMPSNSHSGYVNKLWNSVLLRTCNHIIENNLKPTE